MQEESNEGPEEAAEGVAIAVERVEEDRDEGVVGWSGLSRQLVHSFY
jgi:hypothetical protein